MAAASLANDITLASGPEDTISALAFSPAANHLAVASWDSKVRIYDLTSKLTGEGVALIPFAGPVLSCDWSKDGQKVAGSGADKTALLLDLASNGGPAQQVALHSHPIRTLRFFQSPNSHAPLLVTGSWDKTVKYWDLRQPSPIGTLSCQDRIYSLDVKEQLLVIATAERWINVVDLGNPLVFFRSVQSPLRWQTRVVRCFDGGERERGYAFAGIEGRCGFQYVEEKDASKNFTFKCHRDQPINNTIAVHTVNDISFHPVHGTFSTCSSDGTYQFWDKDSHHRLKAFPPVGGSITATSFSRDGEMFAYAVGYDWSKGYAFHRVDYPTKVVVHPVGREECKPRVVPRRR